MIICERAVLVSVVNGKLESISGQSDAWVNYSLTAVLCLKTRKCREKKCSLAFPGEREFLTCRVFVMGSSQNPRTHARFAYGMSNG